MRGNIASHVPRSQASRVVSFVPRVWPIDTHAARASVAKCPIRITHLRLSSWHGRCSVRNMDHAISRLLAASAGVVLAGVFLATACTHSNDRAVVEPVGGGDASTTTPDLGDAGVSPIGPIAHPIEPEEDFRLVRAPEFGIARETQPVSLSAERAGGLGGLNAGGNAGFAGSDLRPVASGGSYY